MNTTHFICNMQKVPINDNKRSEVTQEHPGPVRQDMYIRGQSDPPPHPPPPPAPAARVHIGSKLINPSCISPELTRTVRGRLLGMRHRWRPMRARGGVGVRGASTSWWIVSVSDGVQCAPGGWVWGGRAHLGGSCPSRTASNARPGGGCEGGEHILVDRVRLGRRPMRARGVGVRGASTSWWIVSVSDGVQCAPGGWVWGGRAHLGGSCPSRTASNARPGGGGCEGGEHILVDRVRLGRRPMRARGVGVRGASTSWWIVSVSDGVQCAPGGWVWGGRAHLGGSCPSRTASNARPGGGCEGGEHILVDRVRLGRPPIARPGGGCEGGEHILVDRVRLGRRPIARIRTRSCMHAHAHTNARSDGFFPLTLFMQPTVVRHKSIKLLVSSWRSGLYDNTQCTVYRIDCRRRRIQRSAAPPGGVDGCTSVALSVARSVGQSVYKASRCLSLASQLHHRRLSRYFQ